MKLGAHAAGLTVWAMTGRGPNPLTGLAAESLVVDGPSTATVQEVHLVALHLICAAFDVALGICPEELAPAGARRGTR